MAQSHVANPLQLEEHSQPYQLALHISISSSLRPLIHTHQRYSKVGFENCRNMDSTWKVEELYLPPKNHKSAEELQTGADRLASWIAKLQSGQNYSFFPHHKSSEQDEKSHCLNVQLVRMINDLKRLVCLPVKLQMVSVRCWTTSCVFSILHSHVSPMSTQQACCTKPGGSYPVLWE